MMNGEMIISIVNPINTISKPITIRKLNFIFIISHFKIIFFKLKICLDGSDKPPDYNDIFGLESQPNRDEAFWKERTFHLRKGFNILAENFSGCFRCMEQTCTFNFYLFFMTLMLILIILLIMDIFGAFKHSSNGYL